MLILLLAGRLIEAGEINNSEVDYQDGVYSLTFDVVIDSDLAKVQAIVTDYANIADLSDLFTQSALLDTGDDSLKRLLVARACVLFFCRHLRIVEAIDQSIEGEITTTIIPEESDFQSGMTHWQLTELDTGKTRIEFYGDEEPAFWVPPFIGPVLVKHRLLTDALVIIKNIEARAAGD